MPSLWKIVEIPIEKNTDEYGRCGTDCEILKIRIVEVDGTEYDHLLKKRVRPHVVEVYKGTSALGEPIWQKINPDGYPALTAEIWIRIAKGMYDSK